jgi:hypothetical protein
LLLLLSKALLFSPTLSNIAVAAIAIKPAIIDFSEMLLSEIILFNPGIVEKNE